MLFVDIVQESNGSHFKRFTATSCSRRARLENKQSKCNAWQKYAIWNTAMTCFWQLFFNLLSTLSLHPSTEPSIHLSHHLSCPTLTAAGAGTPADASGNREGNTLHRSPVPLSRPYRHKDRFYQFGITNRASKHSLPKNKDIQALSRLVDCKPKRIFSGVEVRKEGRVITQLSN